MQITLLLISSVLFAVSIILLQVWITNWVFFYSYTLLNFLSLLTLAIILLNVADLQIKY